MNKSLEKVKEFRELFDFPIGDHTKEESLQSRRLGIKLIFEELQELATASGCEGTFESLCRAEYTEEPLCYDKEEINHIEELDALCDLKYVLYGKIIAAGYHEIFDVNFDLVHENNMQKAHKDIHHCSRTIAINNYAPWKAVEKGDKYLLYNQDGKLIKPHDFKKVELKLYTSEL
jgi:predicted HAD superfamily Cof-like phosphohydrolase